MAGDKKDMFAKIADYDHRKKSHATTINAPAEDSLSKLNDERAERSDIVQAQS